MKHFVFFCTLSSMFVMQPAFSFAGDGQVPNKVLSKLGLSEMKVLSDPEGEGIRGKSGVTFSRGASTVSAILFDRATGSFVLNLDGNSAAATAESGGSISSIPSMALHGSSVALSLAITTTGSNFNSFITGGAGGSSFATLK